MIYGNKFVRAETEAQIALGTYEEWWITLLISTIYDPEELPGLLDTFIPKRLLWSDGMYQCWMSRRQLKILVSEFSKGQQQDFQRSGIIGVSVKQFQNGRLQQVWNA